MLCDVLDNNFSIFFSDYVLKNQSDNFDNFDSSNMKSKIKMILKNKIIFPHEAFDDIFDFDEFKKKYERRIKRFDNIVKDKNIKKIFVRADNTKISDIDKDKLCKSLEDYGCVNYEIKFINYSEYKLIGEFTWQRDYIDWIF